MQTRSRTSPPALRARLPSHTPSPTLGGVRQAQLQGQRARVGPLTFQVRTLCARTTASDLRRSQREYVCTNRKQPPLERLADSAEESAGIAGIRADCAEPPAGLTTCILERLEGLDQVLSLISFGGLWSARPRQVRWLFAGHRPRRRRAAVSNRRGDVVQRRLGRMGVHVVGRHRDRLSVAVDVERVRRLTTISARLRRRRPGIGLSLGASPDLPNRQGSGR